MPSRYIIVALYLIIFALLTANMTVIYSEAIQGHRHHFASLFYFDRRLNVPFFFSLALLLINIVLLYRITTVKTLTRPQIIFWRTLLITFVFFTIDEAFYIHQHFKMRTFGTIASYNPASWTHYLWVIPYFVIFGTLTGILFRHASSISADVKRKLLIAAAVFLSGAMVMEFAGTFYAVVRPADVYLLLIKSAEGALQMTGAVMFAQVLLRERK